MVKEKRLRIDKISLYICITTCFLIFQIYLAVGRPLGVKRWEDRCAHSLHQDN